MSSANTRGDVRVLVWSKGFQVTETSREFQRVAPCVEPLDLSVLASRLDDSPAWLKVLGLFYKLRLADAVSETCLLFGSSEVASATIASFRDRHGRPSALAVASFADLSNEADPTDMAHVIARLVSVSRRLATSYSATFEGNPDYVEAQLRENRFLSARPHALTRESLDDSLPWARITGELQKWQGVSGFATSRLLSLGSNVLLGTADEAETLAGGDYAIEAYLDVGSGTLVRLGEGLEPIVAPPEPEPAPAVPPPAAPHSTSTEPRGLEATLTWIGENVLKGVDLLAEIRDQLAAGGKGSKKRVAKRKKKG